MEMVLGEQDAVDWVYKGEGAVHLVLGYKGSSPAFVGKVMRFQKEPTNVNETENENADDTSVLTSHEKLVWRDHKELLSCRSTVVLEQMFVKHVISPLLGPDYVDAGILVQVSKKFLESVEKNVTSQRPSWRVDASKVDIHLDSVLLMNDLSLFSHGVPNGEPCICVEIKPKCGFLPVSRFMIDDNDIKRSTARFSMHQVLKSLQNEIADLSEYNPLDLFSGSVDRIHQAIKALYATPQNNFRVFLNGSLVFGGLGGGTDNTSFATGQMFENVLNGVIKADEGVRTVSFLELVASAVYNSAVLDRLLEIQKLDKFDIEGAIHAYYNITSQPCMACRELGELAPRYASLHSISLEESLKIVKDYLIAATAKDCSLMVTFRPREPGGSEASCRNVFLQSTKQTFDYKAYFIDLALKPLKKVEDYYELDKKIVTCYTELLENDDEQNRAVSPSCNISE